MLHATIIASVCCYMGLVFLATRPGTAPIRKRTLEDAEFELAECRRGNKHLAKVIDEAETRMAALLNKQDPFLQAFRIQVSKAHSYGYGRMFEARVSFNMDFILRGIRGANVGRCEDLGYESRRLGLQLAEYVERAIYQEMVKEMGQR